MNTARLVENEQQATAIVKFFPQWNMILFLHGREKFQIFSTAYIGAKKGRVWTCFVVFPFPFALAGLESVPFRDFLCVSDAVWERPTPDGIDSTRHTHTHNDNLFVFYFCIHTLCVVKSPLWRERESKWADTANRLTIIYTHKNVKNSVAGRHLLCLLLEFFCT